MANKKFQAALRCEAQPCPPVWLMRQAGRYHRHYQKLRQKHSFMELCKVPELAAEVTRGPIQDFDFDAAILFSDLLFPLEALGMGLQYSDAKGPELGWHLTETSLKKLRRWDEALPFLQFQGEAMRAAREVLPKDKSLIGFVGGYWTLFTYAIQGKHDGHLLESKKSLSLFPAFVEVLKPLLQANIELQLKNGAEIVMLFDTAAGELAPGLFRKYVENALVELAEIFPQKLGYYSKGTQIDYLQNLRNDPHLAGIGVDHRWTLPELLKNRRAQVKHFYQGNFDQALLHVDASDLKKHLKDYFRPFRDLSDEERRGWICGLGHGVLPKTPEDNVRLFVQSVRDTFRD